MRCKPSILCLPRLRQWPYRSTPAAAPLWLLAAASLALGACAEVPDAVNPVSWYKGVAGWFEDEEEPAAEEAKASASAEEAPGAKQSFPTLAEVPQKPVPVTTVEERRRVMEGLSADRENARYADEAARAATPAEGQPAAPAPATNASAASASPAASAAPAPPAAPPSGRLMKPSELAADIAAPPPAPSAAPLAPAPPAAAEVPAPAPAAGAEAAPPVPAPPPAGEIAPPPPVAPGTAPALAVPAAPGTDALTQTFEAKLKESAPAVTTAPAGPTGGPAPTGPVPSSTIGAGEAAAAEAAGAPPAGASTGAIAFGESAGFRSIDEFPAWGASSAEPASVVYFAHGSAHLSSDDKRKLQEIAALYKERGGVIRVVGHASSRTGDMDVVRHQMANFTVSVRRADSVARELVRLGVKPEHIYVGARSDSEPIYYESMPAGEAGNRRAEIFVDYQQGRR